MSRAARLFRSPLVVALLSGAWVAVYIVLDERSGSWPLWLGVPLCVAGILLLRRVPLLGAALVLMASAISASVGLPYGEIELLLPTVYVLAQLGRTLGSRSVGLTCVIAFSIGSSVRTGAPWYAVLISSGLYGAVWLFGRIVRRRAQAAVAAARTSADLASVDLERVMSASGLDARLRAADEALTSLRAAVERMNRVAASAWSDGPPYRAEDIDALRREADRAIGRLHDCLTLLDSGQDSAEASDGVRQAEPSEPRRRGDAAADGGRRILWWVLGALVTAAAVAVMLLYGGQSLPLLLAAAIAPVCAAAVSRFPFTASVAAAGAFVYAATVPVASPYALLPLGLSLAVLLWHLVGQSSVAARITIPFVVLAACFLGLQFGRQGVGFVLVLAWVTVGAASAWCERDEILQNEQARAVALTAGIAAAKLRADRAERRQLARELHDGVSHGVTAMSLQARAAHALGATDPERSRRSMALACEVGARTLHEIDALAAGRVERADTAGHALSRLIEGGHAAGLDIEYASADEADVLTYRIVQEALTNVTRYAPGSRVVIETGLHGDRRFVRVTDTGAGLASGVNAAFEQLGHGRGLRGLADRVSERGGEFRSGARRMGPHDPVGFEVHAEWPVAQMATSPVHATGGKRGT